jgi:hypothetical protein
LRSPLKIFQPPVSQRLDVAAKREPALGSGELPGAPAGAGLDVGAIALDDEMAAGRAARVMVRLLPRS